jgi:hypothetical protein
MSQGTKKYKIRRSPPPSGRQFLQAPRLALHRAQPSTPPPKRQKRFAPFRSGQHRHRYHFYRAISSATRTRRALFRSLPGRKPLDSLAIVEFVIFWRAVPSSSQPHPLDHLPSSSRGSLALSRELTFSQKESSRSWGKCDKRSLGTRAAVCRGDIELFISHRLVRTHHAA